MLSYIPISCFLKDETTFSLIPLTFFSKSKYLFISKSKIYFLLELYDIIPSSILSQFGVPKLGNSRVLFNDFNLDYAGDGAGYYIGSLTYVPLINTFFGKLLYLLGLGYMLRLFSIYFNNSFVVGLLIFNMDFLFNGNYSYFIILFFVPVIIVNVMQFLLKRNHRV